MSDHTHCPRCGDCLIDTDWCKHCGDISYLDDYPDDQLDKVKEPTLPSDSNPHLSAVNFLIKRVFG